MSCQVFLNTFVSSYKYMRTMEEIQKIFVERLNDLMTDRHLSIAKLSKITNIPRTTINSWTLQIKTPRMDSLDRLADYFEVSVDYLLGREN